MAATIQQFLLRAVTKQQPKNFGKGYGWNGLEYDIHFNMTLI